MMRGPDYAKIDAKELELFRSKYKEYVDWMANIDPSCRPSVGAAIAKTAVLYGKNRMELFVTALREQIFDGKTDPAYKLWYWLLKNKGKRNKNNAYFKTISAARAYAENRKLISELRAERDLFTWTETYDISNQITERDVSGKFKKK